MRGNLLTINILKCQWNFIGSFSCIIYTPEGPSPRRDYIDSPLITYRRPKSLRDGLVGAKRSSSGIFSMHQCHLFLIHNTKSFVSLQTGRDFTIRDIQSKLSCNTSDLTPLFFEIDFAIISQQRLPTKKKS